MTKFSLQTTFRRYWAKDRLHLSARVALALIGAVVPCWYLNATTAVTPLVLGIIAAALAETDDNLTGRLKALAMTLLCFLIASLSVELLFDYPALFAIGLFSSSFGFIMLGAMGTRYASIAFASLLLAIYTMLGAESSQNLWFQPALLLSGAIGYGLLSLLWQMLWPNQAVQHSLASVFTALADYLDDKSRWFRPVDSLDPQQLRIQAAASNARVVSALNQAKQTLLNRVKRVQHNQRGHRFLSLYFHAQDIHERISSSHQRYQDLAATFRRSDILFRFQDLMQQQATACRNISSSLAMGNYYRHSLNNSLALDELKESLSFLKSQNNPEWRAFLTQLDYLFNNLATIERQLANLNNPDVAEAQEDTELADSEAHTVSGLWQRVKSQLHTDSQLFRHAVRIATALTIGYGVIHVLDLQHGYWILLTTLFVCQPNFSATRQKLTQRIIGTLGGLLVGLPLLYLFPGQEGQLVLMVLAGVAFFVLRNHKYTLATGFITLLVLFCFNQLGAGFAVVLPRLGDTLLGCLLAVLAVVFILPDWQSRRLHKIMAAAVTTNRDYLAQIIGQYRIGKKDSLSYRVARREAHNTDAQLSTAISNMLAEPGRYRLAIEECFRFLTLNHAMLNYISTLGAHRTQIDEHKTHKLIAQAHSQIHIQLDTLAQQLADKQCAPPPESDSSLEQALTTWREGDDQSVRLILQQLFLIQRMMPELYSLANKLAARTQQVSDIAVAQKTR
ncbi:YccS family putative transporter [Photobacterium sp. 2_MG-2023]|uniref:YccS family putative transporter n=1 Tax=Photobacterium sp. 2_MG-2023 TaxID=3062663 RepID=UPI0026E273F9|nr:YccS family putative transporter [Photobacterium sp. 2_MG-2023]MDO6581149.1 YccS family putative transporter [Photobacterium sp. 2_MG-2023]